jgi:hypothetical protein
VSASHETNDEWANIKLCAEEAAFEALERKFKRNVKIGLAISSGELEHERKEAYHRFMHQALEHKLK